MEKIQKITDLLEYTDSYARDLALYIKSLGKTPFTDAELVALKTLVIDTQESIIRINAKATMFLMNMWRKEQCNSILATYTLSFAQFNNYFDGIADDYFKIGLYHEVRPEWLQQQLRVQRIDYKNVLSLIKLGYEFNDIDIANSLVESTHNYDESEENIGIDSFVVAHPIILEEHIWTIFRETTKIHEVDHYREGKDWFTIVSEQVDSQQLPRQRVLQACLQSSTHHLPRLSINWFFKLFVGLKPTDDELILLLPDMMQVLNCEHGKPIGDVLKHVKKLCTNAAFDADAFMQASHNLLTFESKTVINSTLMIFDKLAKKHADIRPQLCEMACMALLVRDEKIQTRVAKLVIKHGDDAIAHHLASYEDTLFSSARGLLAPLMPSDLASASQEELSEDDLDTITDVPQPSYTDYLTQQITLPSEFDDQLYFISQAFDNATHSHSVVMLDLYLAVMLDLACQLNETDLGKLTPILKSAIRVKKSSSNKYGEAENVMAIHFFIVVSLLLEKYDCKPLETLHNKVYDSSFDSKPSDYHDFYNQIDDRFHKYTRASRLFEKLAQHNLTLIRSALENDSAKLSLLSTPTHAPCFIAVETLLDRLALYQACGQNIHQHDFQVAIARLAPFECDGFDIQQHDIATRLNALTGELNTVLTHLLTAQTTSEISAEKQPLDLSPCKTLSWWSSVLYRKANQAHLTSFIKQFNLHNELAFYMSDITYHIDVEKTSDYRFTYLRTGFTDKGKPTGRKTKLMLLHQDMFCDNYFNVSDTSKALALTPFNPSLPLINMCIHDLASGYTECEQMAEKTLPLLMNVWQFDFPTPCYLYAACALTAEKKTAISFGAEFWIHTVTHNCLDNQRLGKIMGDFAFSEFTPMKRFTDLLAQQLMGISHQHNLALVTLISNMLPAMNDTPIKGTKKLLALYLELLTVTQTQLTGLENAEKIQDKLAVWAETKSLKAVIKKLVTQG